MDGDRLAASLNARGRCKHTGGKLVCNGHWDYWGDGCVWTRHTPLGVVLYRVVPYAHPAPEMIENQRWQGASKAQHGTR